MSIFIYASLQFVVNIPESDLIFFIVTVLTPELRPCVIQVNGDEGFPKKADISNETLEFNAKYGLPIDCIWAIKVKDGWRVCPLCVHRM